MGRLAWPGVIALATMALAGRAAAAPAAHDFAIPAESLADALIDAAIQGDISISLPRQGLGSLLAGALRGRMTTDQALERLLRGTALKAVFVDSRTVRIVSRPPPAPISHAPTPAAPPPEPPTQDTEVVITGATKRREALERLPYAVSALSGARLTETGATSAADVAAQASGLTVTNLGPGRNKLLIRGLSDGAFTGRTQATVGIYLDDTQVTYNAPDPDLKLVDIARVEILRGPQGVTYGAGSVGGIYRMVTNAPDPAALAASATAVGEATAHGAPGGGGDLMLNLPIVKDRLALRAVGYWEQTGGYLDNPVTGKSDTNRTIRQGLRLAVRGEGPQGWSATLGGAYQTIDTADAQYTDEGGTTFRHVALREPHDNDFAEAHVTVGGPTPWGDFTSTTSAIRHQIDSRYDAAAALPLLAPGLTGPAAYDEVSRIDLRIEEARLTSRPGGRLSWLVGVFASSGEQTFSADLNTLAGQAAYHEGRTDHIGETAVFGEVSVPLGHAVALTAGLRWFRTTTDVTSRVEQAQLGTYRDTRGDFATAGTSPKLVLSWRPSDRFGAYLSAAQGYRVGGVNTGGPVAQVFDGSTQPFRRYGGDRLWTYEAGGRASWLDERLRLRAAVFYSEWRNIQSDQILTSGLAFTGNAGTGTVRGLELEAVYSPAPGLDLRANLLLNDPELSHTERTFPLDAEADLPVIPKAAGNAEVRYGRALPYGLYGAAALAASYVGHSGLTFDPTRGHTMGDYALVSLRLELKAHGWGARLYLDNLTDSHADTFSYGNPFSLGSTIQATPPRPRTVGLAVTWSY